MPAPQCAGILLVLLLKGPLVMLPMHTNKASRRARMFELMRQTQLAELTTERLQDPIRLENSVDIAQQFKKDALKSFEAPSIKQVPARLF